ncbi:MAG TPA: tetratricopeptide repeat protein [Burkholderiales bacterium]|nr:tetratricopeptide repeat protein [Burkholderiales bacterium]
MSLINKMLRDLDQRHAPQGGRAGPASAGLTEHVYSVPARKLASQFFWRATAMLMLFAVGWVAWLVWQLTPRPAVTEIVLQSSQEKVSSSKAAASPPALSAVPAPRPASTASSASKSPPTPVVQALPARQTPKANVDTLRLATDLTNPIPKRSARSSSRSAPKKAAGAPQIASAQPVGAGDAGSGKIDLRPTTTRRDRAENEFRRAVYFINQGRIAEGMDGFRSALRIDPGHEAARQTLVALLLEAKRMDAAAGVLREGLAFNAKNTGFAMLLARIMVERKDVSAALLLLQKHAAPPDRDPDFHAFAAALYQRLERHNEAIEQYQAALRLAPSGAVWWVGLGISYQAVDRPKDALEAFTRAKSAGNLAPELLAFVDQRLRQLQ